MKIFKIIISFILVVFLSMILGKICIKIFDEDDKITYYFTFIARAIISALLGFNILRINKFIFKD